MFANLNLSMETIGYFMSINVSTGKKLGFKSHLGLGFFSESTFLLIFNIVVVVVVVSS